MSEQSESTESRFREIVVQQLGVESSHVTSDARFIEDLGSDSLDHVELAMAVEEEFGISVTDEEIEKLFTFGLALKHLEEKLKI